VHKSLKLERFILTNQSGSKL